MKKILQLLGCLVLLGVGAILIIFAIGYFAVSNFLDIKNQPGLAEINTHYGELLDETSSALTNVTSYIELDLPPEVVAILYRNAEEEYPIIYPSDVSFRKGGHVLINGAGSGVITVDSRTHRAIIRELNLNSTNYMIYLRDFRQSGASQDASDASATPPSVNRE